MSKDNRTFNDSLYDEHIPNSVRFWLYLIFLIPSIICSLFVLFYILYNRTLRLALHNHAIIIFLIISLIYEVTIYPWMLYFYYHEGIWKRTIFFCTLWKFIDWGLYYTQTIFLAWATIERHILVFHSKWISTQSQRLCIHYLPLIILLFYCLIYYIIITFLPSCENIFDNYYTICIELCLLKTSALHIYDTIAHQILPNLIIVLFSITLLLRVRCQKHRVGQSLQWRKHWKITIQLLFVSILYLIFVLPVTLMNLLHLCGLSRDKTDYFMDYLLFLNYFMMLLCPFACALSLPQIRDKINDILRLRRQARTVVPTTCLIRDTAV